MQVSVIIPVYKAEKYVRQAVESALAQPETGEVLLIEDASPDGSLQVCKELAIEYASVRFLQHADGKNHGPGASRNLGIREANCAYIAFLDADDYFLPNRFSVAKTLFEEDPELDGVYEAVGYHFEDEAAKEHWQAQFGGHNTQLTTMKTRVPPDWFFEAQAPVGNQGHCHLGGGVVKRSIFAKTGLFDDGLYLHQDTVMFVKFSAVGKMAPGRLEEPVAMRRVHGGNRISAIRPAVEIYQTYILMWATLWRWGKRNLRGDRRQILAERFIRYAAKPYKDDQIQWHSHIQSLRQLTGLFLTYPDVVFESAYCRRYLSNLKQLARAIRPRSKSL